MKAGTEGTVKFKKLQRRLRIPLWQAIGLLEALWQLTARSAPRGDIGKHDNEDIAVAIEYEGDENELIDALVDCGWIDEDETHRLIVHDWHDHAPNYIKGTVKQHKGGFVTKSDTSKTGSKTPSKTGSTKPSLAKPSLAKPTHTPARVPSLLSDHEGFDDHWRRWLKFFVVKHDREMSDIEQETVLMELARAGPEKACRDIAFSISRDANYIYDSDNDYSKAKRGGKSAGDVPRKPKSTAELRATMEGK